MSPTKGIKLGVLVVVGVLLANNLCEGLKLGAFNVKIFGNKKSNNSDVLSVIAKVRPGQVCSHQCIQLALSFSSDCKALRCDTRPRY